MPTGVRKSRLAKGGWDIIDLRTGQKIGWSETETKAHISASYRDQDLHIRKRVGKPR